MKKSKMGTTWGQRGWPITTVLLLLMLIGAPLGATLADVGDIGEETEGFIEFGPPNGDATVELAAPVLAPMFLAPTMLAGSLDTPPGYLPSYDEEALAKFDVQRALESDRYLAIDVGPRVVGTPQEEEAAEYLGAKLESYGYVVSYQHWPTRNDGTNRTQNVATVTSPSTDLQGGPEQSLGGPKWQMSASTDAQITGDEEAVEAEVIYAGSGQSLSDFPENTADKIVMMDYSTSSGTRETAVVNAVSLGAVGVILAETRTNRAPPGSLGLTTQQPDVPVAGGGTAHGDWIRQLIDEGQSSGQPLVLRIATFSYANEGTNVVGVRPAVNDPDGTAPIIMVGGHIDGVRGSPAAHDNGTGPSTAVEIGRVLAQYELDKEIHIVGYGGEEIGMYGSRAYVASLSPEERARFVGAWDLDMEGTPHPPAGYWALTPDGQSNFVVQSAYDAADRFGFVGLQNCKLGQSDHQSFYDAGIPASLFIWLDYRPPDDCITGRGSYSTEPQYHRPTDTMSNVSPERLEISLKLVGGAAFHSALNAVTLSAADGTPVSGAAIAADCGDGQRYLGETDSTGTAAVVIPHATCDFTAMMGLAISELEDVAIFGDVSLTFPRFHLPEPVLLYGSADPAHGSIGADWESCGELDTSSVGAKTVLCIDDVGNISGVNYNVAYDFGGFYGPIDNPPTVNIAKAGRAIPLVWRLTDANGDPVTSDVHVTVTAETLWCPSGVTPDHEEEQAAGVSGLQNLGDGNYQFNWKSPKDYAQSCKTIKLDLGEGPGLEHTAQFDLAR